jgi:hypothetical protein
VNWWRDPTNPERFRVALALYALAVMVIFALGLILRNTFLQTLGACLLLPCLLLAASLVTLVLWDRVRRRSTRR